MSLIYSYLNYCNLIWGAAEKGIIEPLFILKKKAVRIITKSNYLEHTPPIFVYLELLTIYEVYKLNCSLFIYKCLHCNYFPDYKFKIQRNSNYHDYNTRSRNLFRINKRVRLRMCQRSFLSKGIQIWNSLNYDIKQVNSLTFFKSLMKKHLIEVAKMSLPMHLILISI